MHTVSFRSTITAIALLAAGCGVDTSQNGKVKITSVTPDTSSITGGIEVQIGGKGFDGGAEPTVVFGGNAATVTSYSENQIAVTLPGGLGCGNVDIQINNSNGFAIDENAFTYTGGSSVISVLDVSPTLGDIAGGTELTITGSGFTGGAGVLLNGEPMEEIQVVSDTEIRAVTPQQLGGGVADLQVRNCADEETLPAAFLFTSGLNGAYIELRLFDYIRPGQFGGAVDFIDPLVAFVEPTTEPLLNPLPPTIDTCQFNPPQGVPGSFVYQTAGPDVSLTSGAQTIQLDLQSDDLYYFPANDTTANQTAKFVFNGVYALSAPGTASFPGFSAAGTSTAPADFSVSAPSFASDTPANVSKTANLQWTWTAATPGDHMRIVLIGYSDQDLDGDGFADPTNEILNCYVIDDGSYLISAANMGSFSGATGQLVSYAIRRKDTTFILPANGSAGVTVGLIEKVGSLNFP